MTSIQGLLIASALFAAILSGVVFRSRLTYRLVAMVLFLAAACFVLVPDATTEVARRLGVGRGTDLLLYIALPAGVHAFLLLYLRTRRLEVKLTEQIRAAALKDAIFLMPAPRTATAPGEQ